MICKDAPKNITNGLEAIQYLRNTYKRTISFEFDHVHDFKEREWLTKMIESGELFQKNSAEKLSAVLERLTEVEGFEQFYTAHSSDRSAFPLRIRRSSSSAG